MARKKQQSNRRLRKQPKMQRIQSAHVVPVTRTELPKTARKRRRRNQLSRRRLHVSVTTFKQFLFSARWISLGLLALMVYALFTVGMDEQFYLTTIPVEGTISIPAVEIVAASQLAGVHIFSVDPGAAAARIADMPGVVNAAVTLTWPNHVLIEVQEDSPVAVWRDGSEQFWVTKNGSLIPVRATVPGLLTIESEIPASATAVIDIPDISEYDQSEEAASAPALNTSLAFIPQDVLAGAQQLNTLRPNIEKLYYRQSTGLSYQDGRGWRVYFGAGKDMEQKLAIYETMVDELLAQGLTPEYISVSNQEKPYYRAQ